MAPCINAGPFVDALASIKIGSAASLPSGVISTRSVTLTLSEGAIDPAASIAGTAAVSIPFRRETEIGEPDFDVSQQRDLAHLLVGQHEVENVDIFRQPLDPRRPRYHGNFLLHEPAQANLGGGFAVRLPDCASVWSFLIRPFAT